jgi:hypothetical protein
MTKLLHEAVRRLPSDEQDEIARAIMQLAGSDLPATVILSPEEREAIARSKAAADRGEFSTDEQVRAVWAKHGLCAAPTSGRCLSRRAWAQRPNNASKTETRRDRAAGFRTLAGGVRG